MNPDFIQASIGGALIGMASVALLWLNGRIAGISGIFNGIVFTSGGERGWRLMFVFGLIAAGFLYQLLSGTDLIPRDNYPLLLTIAAGFLVGFGTRLGSGCTSGHGICGISRLSPRSIAATIIFVASGIAVATAVSFIGQSS